MGPYKGKREMGGSEERRDNGSRVRERVEDETLLA